MAGVLAAFEKTVEALPLAARDAAVIALGRTLAGTIDEADDLSGEARTKALYLTPHLMNVLKELLATPAARKDVATVAKGDGGGKLGQLRGITGGKTSASPGF